MLDHSIGEEDENVYCICQEPEHERYCPKYAYYIWVYDIIV